MPRIALIGLGYVGLPTAVLLSETGNDVIGCDINETTVEKILSGVSPLEDLDIDKRVKVAVGSGRLTATTKTTEAVSRSDVAIIIVPTPTKDGEEPDLRYIEMAAKDISKALTRGQLVILESTVYPGVTEEILLPILEESGLKAGVDFDLAYCPERYNPEDSLHTIDKTTRIVAGINENSIRRAVEIYSKITKGGVIPVRDIRTAEAAKIIENTQRDLNIALMNEFALILEKLNLDVIEVLEAASTKWNFNKYLPGAGVGGHCLPKDPYYLVKTAERHGYHAQIITAGRKINDHMPHHVFHLLLKGLNENGKAVKGAKIVVLGLSYKENVGDTRKTPSLALVEDLREMEANIFVVDPYVKTEAVEKEFHLSRERHVSDLYYAFTNADAVIFMVSHREFANLDLKRVRGAMNKGAVFVDGRRKFSPEMIKAAGFVYKGVGAGRDN